MLTSLLQAVVAGVLVEAVDSAIVVDGTSDTAGPPEKAVLRTLPCVEPVIAPHLVVFDLDGTLLSTPLHYIAVDQSTPSELAELFVEREFFAGLCKRLDSMGHALAIASFTESWTSACRMAADDVLDLLNVVLPPHRRYLRHRGHIVCGKRDKNDAKGKASHIESIRQQLVNELRVHSVLYDRWMCVNGIPHARAGAHPLRNPQKDSPLQRDRSISFSEVPDPTEEFPYPVFPPSRVILIDDDASNADDDSYQLFECRGGLTRPWYEQQRRLQQILGVSPSTV